MIVITIWLKPLQSIQLGKNINLTKDALSSLSHLGFSFVHIPTALYHKQAAQRYVQAPSIDPAAYISLQLSTNPNETAYFEHFGNILA